MNGRFILLVAAFISLLILMFKDLVFKVGLVKKVSIKDSFIIGLEFIILIHLINEVWEKI